MALASALQDVSQRSRAGAGDSVIHCCYKHIFAAPLSARRKWVTLQGGRNGSQALKSISEEVRLLSNFSGLFRELKETPSSPHVRVTGAFNNMQVFSIKSCCCCCSSGPHNRKLDIKIRTASQAWRRQLTLKLFF